MLLGVPLRHVVPVPTAILLGRVPRRQCPAIVAEHDALEQKRHGRPRCIAAHLLPLWLLSDDCLSPLAGGAPAGGRYAKRPQAGNLTGNLLH